MEREEVKGIAIQEFGANRLCFIDEQTQKKKCEVSDKTRERHHASRASRSFDAKSQTHGGHLWRHDTKLQQTVMAS